MNIYVGNLSYGITEDELCELFSQFGQITNAKLIMDRETGRSKGFGFVEMAEQEAGERAVSELDGQPIDGRNLKVKEAMPRDNKQSGQSQAQAW